MKQQTHPLNPNSTLNKEAIMRDSIKFNPDGSVEFTGKKPNIKIIKPNKKGEYIGSYEI